MRFKLKDDKMRECLILTIPPEAHKRKSDGARGEATYFRRMETPVYIDYVLRLNTRQHSEEGFITHGYFNSSGTKKLSKRSIAVEVPYEDSVHREELRAQIQPLIKDWHKRTK